MDVADTPTGTGNLVQRSWIPAGTLIQGTYRVFDVLGEGGMGVVLHGIDEMLERDVAIKFIHPKHVETKELHELFIKEARAMARVRHPNLVEIYAYGEYEGAPYFVMEYVKGTRLDAWVKQHPNARVSLDEALGVLDQLCRGVGALHAAGAVHRDLKLSNVLLGSGFRVVVTDMGLAGNHSDRGVGSAIIAGTPAYIAPEIATQQQVPQRYAHSSDVYALGVMAFELLTGRLPFEGRSAAALLQAHAYDPPPQASSVAPELSPVFDRVLQRALAKDPAQRVESADALRGLLAVARASLAQPQMPMRILIADDDPSCLRWTAKFVNLSFPGVPLDLAPDGATALRFAKRNPPTIAIIDLSMPGLNGVELTAALRANPSTANVAIVVVTGVGGATDWRLLQQLGASGFLVKPVEPEALNAIIRRLAAQANPRRSSGP